MEIHQLEQNEPQEEKYRIPQFLSIAAVFGILILLVVGMAIAILYTPPLENSGAHTATAATLKNPFNTISLVAESAIVVDLKTGKTLFALNPDVQLPLASLTKIPLVVVVTEALSLDSLITVPRDITSADATMRLAAGEHWRLSDVIDFTLLTSSNEGAELLAESAGRSIREKHLEASAEDPTLWRMNELARELGLRQTYFLNVSGLDISTTLAGSYGSARDMAVLFNRAVKSGTLAFSGTAGRDVLLTSETGTLETVAENTNEAGTEIPGLIMGKTGFTDLAGGNLAVVFDVGIGHPVVAVVLGSTLDGRFEDMKRLVETTREVITGIR